MDEYNFELVDSSEFHKNTKSEILFNLKKITKRITK